MGKISDHDLDVILDVETASAEHEENWLVVKALQELKERRSSDNKMVENIKKGMVIFCKKFEDRRNHSTICRPPDDNECVMLNFCELIENVLESVSTRKENLLVDPLDIKAQLRLVRDRCPDVFMFLRQTSCVKEVLQMGSQCYETTCDACDSCWDKALEGE